MVDGLIKLMSSSDEIIGPINLGNEEETTIKDLALKIIKLINSNSKIINKPLPQDDPKNRCPNTDKAKTILKWRAKTPLDIGLKKTIEYFDNLLRKSYK